MTRGAVITVEEFQAAAAAVEVDRNHLDYADPGFIDTAIHEMNAAEARCRALIARARAGIEEAGQ